MSLGKIYKSLSVFALVILFIYFAINSTQLGNYFSDVKDQVAALVVATQNSTGGTGGGNSNILGGICANYQFAWAVYAPSVNFNLGQFPHIETGRVYDPNDSFGMYPHMDPNTGQPLYGGIPQLMDIPAHKIKFKNDIAALVPDPNYSGMINIDYESWKPQWDLNWESAPNTNIYKVASINLVRQQHPTWSSDAIIAEAKRQFEEAAINFYLATIDAAHEIRPQSKIGAFDLMYNSYWINFSEPSGAMYRAYEDQIAEIWRRLDVIVVDIYQYFPSYNNGNPPTGSGSPPVGEAWYNENRRYIRENIWEGVRLKVNYSTPTRPKTVIAYTWPQYHASQPIYGYEFLRPVDIALGLTYPLELGADGVVIWNYYAHPHFGEFPAYVTNILGPTIENYCGSGTSGPGTGNPTAPPPPPNNGENRAPQVNAGPDQSVSISVGAVLGGTVTDDGKPIPPAVTIQSWSIVSGPSSVVFSTSNTVSTNVTFTVAGTYVLRLTASDGSYITTDDVTVVVNANPPTVAELQARIKQLQDLIKQLQAQLAAGHSVGGGYVGGSGLTSDLRLGSTGAQVTILQKFLVLKGFLRLPAGSGYGTYGPLTKTAVANFQSAHLIYPASGNFGSVTRALVNRLR